MLSLYRSGKHGLCHLKLNLKSINQSFKRHYLYREPKASRYKAFFEETVPKSSPPSGYQTIYVMPHVKLVRIGSGIALFGWLVSLYHLYNCYAHENPGKVKVLTFFPSYLEVGCTLFVISTLLHFLASRHVRFIYKKQGEYKTMLYGLPFSKKLITHTAEDVVVSKKVDWHYLKKRIVFLYPSYFFEERDYYSLTNKS